MSQDAPAAPSPDTSTNLQFRIENPARFFLGISFLFLTWILLRNLWVSDDAFISLRVVDNFLHGYGLVWNVGERVQVFTHPLWLFLLIPFALILDDPLYVFYIPSLLLSLTTVYLVLTRFASGPRATILAALTMVGSAAFIDYSSSGLENPLTHFLLVLLIIFLFREGLSPLRKLFYISLLTGLAALNRMDTTLLFGPALVYQLFQCRTQFPRAIGILFIGFLPLIVWEAFATFYYGFPLPNTYYAKARLALETSLVVDRGRAYLLNSIHWDPITLGTVALGLLGVLVQREAKRVVLTIGMLLYLLYVVSIGGDFMSGRYFSAIFLVGLILLMTFDYSRAFGPIHPNLYYLTLIVILLIALSGERPPVLMSADQPGLPDDEYSITNEKYYYFFATGWVNHVRYPFIIDTALRGTDARTAGISPVENNVIGIFGYFAGPEIYIIDTFALADPLRARLPALGGRIGHYDRVNPAGYYETIYGGFTENKIEDADLRLYYDKLYILTRGNLSDSGRLMEIIKFNQGQYDYLVKRYLETVLTP